MENEVLLATSDGFYYEGVPSTSFIETKEESSLNNPMTSIDATNNTDEATRNIIENVNTGVEILRIFIIILALLSIIIGTLNIRKNKKNKTEKSSEEPIDLKSNDKVKVRKKAVIPYYLLAAILIAFCEILKIAIS